MPSPKHPPQTSQHTERQHTLTCAPSSGTPASVSSTPAPPPQSSDEPAQGLVQTPTGGVSPMAGPEQMQNINISGYVTINPNIAIFQQYPQLRTHVIQAINQAIKEIISPVVERSVTIACITSRSVPNLSEYVSLSLLYLCFNGSATVRELMLALKDTTHMTHGRWSDYARL
jgi:CCR4-NOT transcription complex subunit 1